MKKNLNIVYFLLLCKIENCVDIYMKFDGKVEIICTCNGLSFLLILSMHKQQITQKLTKKPFLLFESLLELIYSLIKMKMLLCPSKLLCCSSEGVKSLIKMLFQNMLF